MPAVTSASFQEKTDQHLVIVDSHTSSFGSSVVLRHTYLSWRGSFNEGEDHGLIHLQGPIELCRRHRALYREPSN